MLPLVRHSIRVALPQRDRNHSRLSLHPDGDAIGTSPECIVLVLGVADPGCPVPVIFRDRDAIGTTYDKPIAVAHPDRDAICTTKHKPIDTSIAFSHALHIDIRKRSSKRPYPYVGFRILFALSKPAGVCIVRGWHCRKHRGL
jgi:hypothetical protein